MASAATVPVELYLHTAYEPDAEFVDGEVELRPMGELDHASWQKALLFWFTQHGRGWDIRVLPELRVQVTASRYRVPDVTVFRRDLPEEQILTRPPVAVFEVLSPEDTTTRLLRKLADYTEMGVLNVFVVDPRTERFYRYEQGSLSLCRDTVVALDGARGHVDWSAVALLRD